MSDLTSTVSSEKFLKHQVQSNGTHIIDERCSKSMMDVSLSKKIGIVSSMVIGLPGSLKFRVYMRIPVG